MFQRLLVPLDGSPRAEEALPLAAHIARCTGAQLSLVRSVSNDEGMGPYYSRVGVLAEEVYEAQMQDAQEYLAHIARSEALQELSLRTQVLSEQPALAILHYAQHEHVDLIILCSHGYTGLKRWALGSVAQKIARHSSVPVLILREKSLESPLYYPEKARPLHALVALDGSSFAESALQPTIDLVTLLGPQAAPGEIHLLRIVKPASDLEERRYLKYDLDIQEYKLHDAQHYLNSVKERLYQQPSTDQNFVITSSIEEDSDTSDTLIRVAETKVATTEGYDLIAIATHGRTGMKRWMVGSITERVLEESKLPLLIVRPALPATEDISHV